MSQPDSPASKPPKKLAKSADALVALREAMEQRLRETQANPEADAAAAPNTDSNPDAKPEPPPQADTKPKTDDTAQPAYDPTAWAQILARIAERSQKLMLDFCERNKDAATPPLRYDPAHISEAFAKLTERLLQDPQRFVDANIALWQGYAKIWQTALERMQGKKPEDAVKPPPTDRRFQDQEWQSNWLFDLLKQFYLLTAQQIQGVIQKESQTLDPKLARKIEFLTRQMVDALSPSNFWMTNPEVLRTTYATGGESLMKGLENLLADLESGQGTLRIRMTDTNAFDIGKNLATTAGKVIYQNNLMQLIQYAPLTPDVRRVPLLIIPPWINKFYILDLREKNSFIRYLVAQGYTVFVVSWVNPDARHAAVNFEDYMADGALTAMREVKKATGEPDINCVGYCIGGTLLATSLAYLKALPAAPPDIPDVKSATYLVTLTDFADPGDLGVFMDDDLVQYAEERMGKQGYMDAATVATVFNMLRANDLIWSYVVNNYLLGKGPTAFDILYWNSDSTNMPATMQSYYLREMYMANKLVKPNALRMKNVPIDLRKITVPSYLLSTREDHIAPWKSTYAATQLYGGDVRFTLAASGHIAGIVNPPSAEKYGYWTNTACPASPDDWFKDAAQHKGSWWPEWLSWLDQFASDRVPARPVPTGIEDAPGSYVKVRAV